MKIDKLLCLDLLNIACILESFFSFSFKSSRTKRPPSLYSRGNFSSFYKFLKFLIFTLICFNSLSDFRMSVIITISAITNFISFSLKRLGLWELVRSYYNISIIFDINLDEDSVSRCIIFYFY